MLKRKISTQRTVIPLDYDKSEKGFSSWLIYVHNSVYVPDQALDVCDVIPYVNKILKYHKAPNT